MSRRASAACTCALLVLLTSCAAGSDQASDGATWVGTITTEGNVTTVVNESGSVWGGTATLVEEASIGVASGPDEYMFGYVYSVYANDDRIVILDDTAGIVRMYSRREGEFLFTVGGRGQGPGEYDNPMIVAMDAEGYTYVFDRGGNHVLLFAPSGDYVTSWRTPDFACCIWNYMHPRGARSLWFPVTERGSDPLAAGYGAREYGDDGSAGPVTWRPDLKFDPPTYHAMGRNRPVPFSGRVVWAPTPDGRVIAGASDRYRFEIVADDRSKTVVTRASALIPADPEELEWRRRRFLAGWGRREDFSWDGSGVLPHRLAFESLSVALSGEMWVGREVGNERLPGCTEDPLANPPREPVVPCFRPVYSFDVFGTDGRYLGDVAVPRGLWPSRLHVDGHSVIGILEDETGTIMVKRYRLVLPGVEK